MNRLAMIVEDDSAARERLGGLFAAQGWDVCLAATASEALALLGRGPEPDFLVLDLGLPDGDGEAVLRAARDAGLRTGIIVCTGMADPLRLMGLREMGPDLTLIKPIDPDVICRLCRT